MIKKFLKLFLTSFLIFIVFYFVAALVGSNIVTQEKESNSPKDHLIYLTSSKIHVDIVLHKDEITSELKHSIQNEIDAQYMSFGYGERGMFTQKGNLKYLKIHELIRAMFINSSAALHVNLFDTIQKNWIEVNVDENQIKLINEFLVNEFKTDSNGNKIIIQNKRWYDYDDFYEANGGYSCFYTCNTWLNDLFKYANMKSCLWTPFKFGISNIYF